MVLSDIVGFIQMVQILDAVGYSFRLSCFSFSHGCIFGSINLKADTVSGWFPVQNKSIVMSYSYVLIFFTIFSHIKFYALKISISFHWLPLLYRNFWIGLPEEGRMICVHVWHLLSFAALIPFFLCWNNGDNRSNLRKPSKKRQFKTFFKYVN